MGSHEDLNRQIDATDKEIERLEGIFDGNNKKIMGTMLEINKIKILKDKAVHIMNCNRKKTEKYCEQMDQLEQVYEGLLIDLKMAEKIQLLDQLLHKISTLESTKGEIEAEFNRAKGMKEDDQLKKKTFEGVSERLKQLKHMNDGLLLTFHQNFHVPN